MLLLVRLCHAVSSWFLEQLGMHADAVAGVQVI
jgi:hypothetical protein